MVDGEIPDVRAAASDDRTAIIARPDWDRCRLRMSTATTPTRIRSTMANVRSSERFGPPSFGRLSLQPSKPLANQLH